DRSAGAEIPALEEIPPGAEGRGGAAVGRQGRVAHGAIQVEERAGRAAGGYFINPGAVRVVTPAESLVAPGDDVPAVGARAHRQVAGMVGQPVILGMADRPSPDTDQSVGLRGGEERTVGGNRGERNVRLVG